ncbi:MAG TPA: hypothetical protein PK867_24245 [Pirellulales bacterium]|nr:hypothetical protein [Pirellulales bacterium]
MIDFSSRGYSADVQLYLVVGELLIRVAKLGPSRCVLREPTVLPSGPAELVVRIDEHEQRWPIFLPRGAALDSSHVEFSST